MISLWNLHPFPSMVSVPDYVKSKLSGETNDLITPIQVSENLHLHADKALNLLDKLNAGENKELANTLSDIRSMALLGKYYACKINGATQLALYRETREVSYQEASVKQLTNALEYWKAYTSNAMQQYKNPLWLKRVGHIDWVKLTREVERDIELAGKEL